MSDFILKYEELESISKYSKELGKRSEDFYRFGEEILNSLEVAM